MRLTLGIILCMLTFWSQAQKQEQVIDKIIAVIGDQVVLRSDLETQYLQFINSGYSLEENTRCFVFEDLLFQKLLLNQAALDSVNVSEDQVNGELDRRLRFFISQIGSEEKLEEYYQKSIEEIKSEFHDLIEDQLLIQTMQQQITANVKVTPSEVREYYGEIPKDSLPYMESEIEVAQIVKKPPISEEEKIRTKERLNEFRERVINGEDFGTLAVLYSEDPGSAKNRGELGYTPRTSLVPEFAAAAFNLAKGQVSEVIETEYGFHIIQFIGRRGDQVNVRHILLTPKVSPADLLKAKAYLDSIAGLLETVDTLTFEIAAEKFSDDKDTKLNGGVMINPQTGTSKFTAEMLGQIDPTLFFSVDKMEKNERSKPIVMQSPDGTKAYRIVKLLTRSEPHVANLVDDYQKIQEVALQVKKASAMKEWVANRILKTYLKITEEFKGCTFENTWVSSN